VYDLEVGGFRSLVRFPNAISYHASNTDFRCFPADRSSVAVSLHIWPCLAIVRQNAFTALKARRRELGPVRGCAVTDCDAAVRHVPRTSYLRFRCR